MDLALMAVYIVTLKFGFDAPGQEHNLLLKIYCHLLGNNPYVVTHYSVSVLEMSKESS